MNLAVGNASLALALAAAVVGALAGAWGAIRDEARVRRWVGPAAVLTFVGACGAVGAMERALITRDWTVRFVAEHGSSTTPPLFNVATMWSALEGSILLWGVLLAGYVVAVARRFRSRLDEPVVTWAFVTMFAVAIFFFGLMLTVARPFVAFETPPGFVDGPGPNPLLQNHILMAVHPPTLYLGYVGFTVPFAFAVAALVTGRLDERWLVTTRRWTLFAWGFLTAGILMGGWWSYEVLGWGGFWGWDPVENASLLPWLCGTAYLHSAIVQERRSMLQVWNLALVCSTFALTILGTFLTRSGAVVSVHAFSTSGVGPALLGFFSLIVVVSVGLIGWRGDELRSAGAIDRAVSRESAFLANNILFGLFTFVVLLGTVFPLLVEAINGDSLSVGAPYFETVTKPIGFFMLTLMALGPVVPWRAGSVGMVADRLWWPAWGGLVAIALPLVFGARVGPRC